MRCAFSRHDSILDYRNAKSTLEYKMPMNVNEASLTATSSASMGCVSKTEIPLNLGSGVINSNAQLSPSHALYNIQGQKWQQVFDFEKVLKQLRTAEKNFLRGKGVDKNALHISASATGGTTQRPVVIQVQRLNSQDMQFFDLAPKQTARDIVICNSCKGYYTKMGFNNHMMVQHPNIWNSVSSKLLACYANETHINNSVENKLDGSRNIDALKEVVGSPMDVSSTVSTCTSNASSLTLPYITAARATTASPISTSNILSATSSSRKSIAKSSSSKGGSSSGSTSSRSRSKIKSQNQSSSTSLPLNSPAAVSTLMQSYHKSSAIGSNSKKSSSTSTSVAAITAPHASITAAPHSINSQNDAGESFSYSNVTTTLPITVYSSSSSNSSCSLPTTPKMLGVQDTSNIIVTLPGALLDSSVDSYVPVSGVPSQSDIKNKQANGHHSTTSTTKTKAKTAAALSGRELIDSTTSSSSNSEFENAAHKQKSHHVKIPKKPVSAHKKPPYEMQLSELDQAVSSITAETVDETKVSQVNENMRSTAYMQHLIPTAGTDEHIQQNASDENSISLTLDDMLDSKFINEILNTAESEIPFDESVLDPAVQQTSTGNINYIQQPNCKRMRYDEGTMQTQSLTNNISSELGTVGEYAAVYHQHQYDVNQLENIKLYHQENAVTGDVVQVQPQLNAIDAIHLQQLIFQQQQMLEAEHKHIGGDANAYTSLTYEPNEQMSANATTTRQQFSVYNVPSLTDDNVAPAQLEEMMLPTSIIYEISANSQVTTMDQQSQQQVLAEFLTHAGYDNVEQMSALTDAAVYEPSAAWANFNELCDIDLSKLETVTTLTSTTSSTSTPTSLMSEKKTVELAMNQQNCQSYRHLTHTKYHEDFYFNMFLYSGIPRPLAMNTFGMVKLSQNAATTFKKHILATRKANNSLLSLNGNNVCGINGVIGSNGSVTRFPHHTGITKQNFYNTTSPTTSVNANEFSIGSITITNATNNGSGALGLTTQTSSGRSKVVPTFPAVAPTTRSSTTNGTSSSGIHTLNNKTIHVTNSNTISNEQIRCMKRALVSKIDHKNGVFTAKKLNELLNYKMLKDKETEKSAQQQQDQFIAQDKLEKCEFSLQQPMDETKTIRMQSFYEKRRKLLNMSKGLYAQSEHVHHQHHILRPNSIQSSPIQYTQKQRQEKLLKKQLIRTLTDCGINQWKSNSNSPSGGGSSNGATGVTGNDLMRVFV